MIHPLNEILTTQKCCLDETFKQYFISEVTNKTVHRGGCAKQEAFNFTTIHKTTTCYCGTDSCNAPGSSCKSSLSSYIFVLFKIFILIPLFLMH